MKLFWLTFCDANRPAGSRYLGGVFLFITEETLAELASERDRISYLCRLTWQLGCNPGGAMMVSEVEPLVLERFASFFTRFRLLGRLLDREESTRRWTELTAKPN